MIIARRGKVRLLPRTLVTRLVDDHDACIRGFHVGQLRSVPSELVSESQGKSLVSDRRVRVDGVDLQYLEAGSGPPLLLLHGHEQSATSWRWVIPASPGPIGCWP